MTELTDFSVRQAKPGERQYTMFDTNGLHLVVRPTGTKTWRLRQMRNGKQSVVTLGDYPTLTLARARQMRDGIRGEGAETRFETMARRWWENRLPAWKEETASLIWLRIEANILPKLGERPVALIRGGEVKAVIDTVKARGKHELARRCLQYLTQIFALACVELDLQMNPAAELARATMARPRTQHRKRVALDELGPFLVKLDQSTADYTTKRAFEFLILTAARTGEVRFAEWTEFEKLDRADGAIWRIPAARMKMGSEHLVPLSRQAVKVLRLVTGGPWPDSGLVFPGDTGTPMSENTLLFLLYRLGYRGTATVHGMRGLFSTWANEAQWNADVIERALAHVPQNEVRRAYNAAKWLPERRELLKSWGDAFEKSKKIASLL